jgi:hypothetical protein
VRLRPDGLLEAESFEEHMMPGVTWIDDPAYAAAFADLIGDETVTEAAYTKPAGSYPGFINIQRDATGAFIVMVRADPMPADGPVDCGQTAVVTIPEDDWYQLLADAARLRVPSEDQHALGLEDDGGAGAVPGDPLAQRSGEAGEDRGPEPAGDAEPANGA